MIDLIADLSMRSARVIRIKVRHIVRDHFSLSTSDEIEAQHAAHKSGEFRLQSSCLE